jgi:hypothetical protein
MYFCNSSVTKELTVAQAQIFASEAALELALEPVDIAGVLSAAATPTARSAVGPLRIGMFWGRSWFRSDNSSGLAAVQKRV